MYNFYGIEILDNCDLNSFRDLHEKNKIIFLTDIKSPFDNSFLIKIYNLKHKIGEGSFGKVYLAEQKFTKDLYAMKKLSLRFSKFENK